MTLYSESSSQLEPAKHTEHSCEKLTISQYRCPDDEVVPANGTAKSWVKEAVAEFGEGTGCRVERG